jgi:hypothetical protein
MAAQIGYGNFHQRRFRLRCKGESPHHYSALPGLPSPSPGQSGRLPALKHDLAAKFNTPEQRHEYVRAKAPFVWETMQVADEWAGEVGWEPGPSDA